jgi:hypothetical protein
MLLLAPLFGPCIINALSRFISQQVQWIRLQVLVKEYSPLPMHEPSIQFYRGLWRPQGSTSEKSATAPTLPPPSPHCQQEIARWVIAPLPSSCWVLVSEGELVGSGNLKTEQHVNIPSPKGALWTLHPEKETYNLANLPQGW